MKRLETGDNEVRGATSVSYPRVSMDTARNVIKRMCEQDPRPKVAMIVSYGSNGDIESTSLTVTTAVSRNCELFDRR
jgi:hypothetical protein